MSFFQSHNRSFRAEWIKMKHSGMLWLCIGAAMFIPLLTTLVLIFVNVGEESSANAWNDHIKNNFTAFTGFFYPLFLVLLIGRLVYLEHRSDTWKLLETQPVSRFALFIVKFETAALIALLCLIAFSIFNLIGGFIIQLTSPKYGFAESPIDWITILSAVVRFWITGLAILAAQYFFGLLIKSFAWPIGIGLLAIIAGSIMSGFGIITWWPYSGTSMTSASYSGSIIGNFLLPHEKLSLLWTVAFLAAGYAYYASRTVKKAYGGNFKRMAISVGSVVVFIFLTSLLNKPVILQRYHKTILAGSVNDSTIKDIVILTAPAYDTFSRIPVIKGKFHGEIKKPMPAGLYYVRAGQSRTNVYMGDRDSTFMEIKFGKKQKESRISGTRIAENEFLKLNTKTSFYNLYEYAYEYTPQVYAELVEDAWMSGLNTINDFTTTDQIKPSEDFIRTQRKLLALQLISLADYHYPPVFSVYHPNEELKFPSLGQIRKEIDINDISLISHWQYWNYVDEKIKNDFGEAGYFNGLKKTISNPSLLDVLSYMAIEGRVLSIKDSLQREVLFAGAMESVNDPLLKSNLIYKNELAKKLRKGSRAGNISAETINGKNYTLTDLKGRYIVLDVWATWCKPCVKEAPFYEELATRYTQPRLAFVSISIDEKINDWKIASARKKNSVLQLWAKNFEEDIMKGYGFNTIPRFILIDDRGVIINGNMPPPSDPEFEAILLREIPFLKNLADS